MESVRLPHPDVWAIRISSIPITLSGLKCAEALCAIQYLGTWHLALGTWLCLHLVYKGFRGFLLGAHGLQCAWIAHLRIKACQASQWLHVYSFICPNPEWTCQALTGCNTPIIHPKLSSVTIVHVLGKLTLTLTTMLTDKFLALLKPPPLDNLVLIHWGNGGSLKFPTQQCSLSSPILTSLFQA